MSALPPGGNGTTIRIVLDVCAQASAPINVTAMRAAVANVFQRRIIPQWRRLVMAVSRWRSFENKFRFTPKADIETLG
jgi:hypothetical protein